MTGSEKISKLPTLTTPAAEDNVAIVDFGASKTKEINMENLFGGMPKSSATKVVAASDTSEGESRADYVCDGTDDHLTIQEALDALPVIGGKVELLEGTYACDGGILMPDETSLVGSGKATLLNFDVVQDIGITNVLGWGGGYRLVIANMKLDGFNKTNDPIELTKTYNSLITNLEVIRGNDDGIELAGCQDCIISNVIVKDSNRYNGIELDDNSYNCIISHCITYDCPESGIALDINAHDNLVVGCISRDSVTAYGIILSGTSHDNVVIGNLTEGNSLGPVLDSGTDNTVFAYRDGNAGFGTGAPTGKYHIDQAVDDAAIPVLVLDQADVSEGFINFIGSDRGVIAGATASTVSVRVELGGVVYRLALYVDA